MKDFTPRMMWGIKYIQRYGFDCGLRTDRGWECWWSHLTGPRLLFSVDMAYTDLNDAHRHMLPDGRNYYHVVEDVYVEERIRLALT